MEDKDHLDKQVEISAKLTEQGVEAKSTSRLIAAVDRLGGNIAELLNVQLEGFTAPRRSRIEAQRQLMKAAADHGIERMSRDPEFVERVLVNQLGKMERAQANKDGVMQEALDDLRVQPSNPEEDGETPDALSPIFLDRFEGYAEQASTDELRHRWGRVFAAEIRKPGTFSQKVLRIVDELESDTAKLFEELCQGRIGYFIPKSLIDDLTFGQKTMLSVAGLILDPSLGQLNKFTRQKTDGGMEVYMCGFRSNVIGIPVDAEVRSVGHFNAGDPPSMDVYILTEEGFSISQILPNTETKAASALAAKLRCDLPGASILHYQKDHEGNWVVVD